MSKTKTSAELDAEIAKLKADMKELQKQSAAQKRKEAAAEKKARDEALAREAVEFMEWAKTYCIRRDTEMGPEHISVYDVWKRERDSRAERM